MMKQERKSIEEARRAYSRRQAEAGGWDDPRLEEAFWAIRREDFLPQPPWLIIAAGRHTVFGTISRSSDPVDLYDDVLVSLDSSKGINNGEPTLHAGWIGKVRPLPGETVVHIGAGGGYYTAVLGHLVAPGGKVIGYEIDGDIAQAAIENLRPYPAIEIRHADAVSETIPSCDIIYVNAGVVAPPAQWLKALKPGGRLVFPWRPATGIGRAVLITRTETGFSVDLFSSAWFIPCIGASDQNVSILAPDEKDANASRSVVLCQDMEPDETATAIYADLWFSSRAPPAHSPTVRHLGPPDR